MKKLLSVWLSLSLAVSAGVTSTLKNENKYASKYTRYLLAMDDFLYHRVENKMDIKNLTNENFEEILKEAFYVDDFGKELFNNITFEVLKIEDGELTILFKDKNNLKLLNENIILKFNLVLFNYDKINDFIYVMNNFLKNNPLILTKSNYIQLEVEDLLKSKFKKIFDRYSSSVLFLDNINEFWEFIDFEELENENPKYLNASFLNDTKLDFKLLRDSQSFGNEGFDKYINFSVNENIFKREIFNWIKKHSFFKENVKNYDDIFTIEEIRKNKVTISLSDKLFTVPKLITLNKIK
ncbi:hypothetical protein [Spiroplasma floricola]|uniref:Uncharacterized protein n=1 Tax=Spiroplasma floricola 23-6 TaxID=1336749 RepID=A0A2K8SEN6_9MOLU|nr:hypothetical protein [Spiroplasma floricola]AUB31927.1 hypothetical protein SFLOR_v1c08790 [Spiroplasma floricola 23-6]